MKLEPWQEIRNMCNVVSVRTLLTGALAYTLHLHQRTFVMYGTDKERGDKLMAKLDDLFSLVPADIASYACVNALMKKRFSEPDAKASVQQFVLEMSPDERGIQ